MRDKQKRLIDQDFPFGELSIVAEQESWRKEVNRPASYIHKWWARRLGSVFRGLIIGGAEKPGADFFEKFYAPTLYPNKVVFDPFMGSGTTVHEAVKLGATAIGSDINPVAVALVRTAADEYNRSEVMQAFQRISENCKDRIQHYYKAVYGDAEVDVLYYFWVMDIDCDSCGAVVPLMKSSIFSKNAYASKKPAARSICPFCGHINEVLFNDTLCSCSSCQKEYNPQEGNIHGIEYVCPNCGKHEKIVDYMRRKGCVPRKHMYAKMIIDKNGSKRYVDIDEYDLSLYKEAESDLPQYLPFIPTEKILDGINTSQILNYQYHFWYEMFNARQLLAFGILSKEIKNITDPKLRRLFAVLMSGTLEFNNMFCSFKGEGTGAVRPLFYNHILKNELMPLEANPWGCKASSGSFSTLFETRILRMLDYKEKPFELRPLPGKKSEKVYLKDQKLQARVVTSDHDWAPGDAIILCADSSHTSIPDKTVDLVITDPPFFDNVNYSELADFFYVWLKRFDIDIGNLGQDSTRAVGEVQDNDARKFASKLCDVFSECYRVLKDDGLLIFTYHHSRVDGWVSVYNAISGAGFSVSEVIPIKAEMSVSVAIMAAKEPINYDLVFVCRKAPKSKQIGIAMGIQADYQKSMQNIRKNNLQVSYGDKMILIYGLALKQLSECGMKSISEEDIEGLVASVDANSL